MPPQPMTIDALYRACDPATLDFKTTDDLEPLREIVGQPRAVDAVRFGVGIDREGYNIFALGDPGTGKRTLIRQFLEQRTEPRAEPVDLCYVNNFAQPHYPRALRMPAGRGHKLAGDMEQLVDDAGRALAQAFESDDYRQARQRLEQEVGSEQQDAMKQLQEKAREKGLTIMQAQGGVGLAPMDENGQPMPPQQVQQLPQEQREKYEQAAQELQEEIQKVMQKGPRLQREAARQLRELNHKTAEQAVGPLVDDLKDDYRDVVDGVQKYLDAVKHDLIENGEHLLKVHQAEQTGQTEQQPQSAGGQGGQSGQSGPGGSADPIGGQLPGAVPQKMLRSPLLRRYRVNVIVESNADQGPPVVYEDNPTYQNLVGRIEHMAQMGALISDFNLIKPGALHRATGGYLILDAHRVLMQPLTWEALKRALRSGEVRIESPNEAVGLVSTVTLEPEPIRADVKVVLLGSRMLYMLLQAHDPDFAELFKVAADFDDQMDRTPEQEQLYARLIASVAQKDGLKPLDKGAVGRVIERAARLAGDRQKLSIHMRAVADLLREADYWAGENGNGHVTADDVQTAIDRQTYRADRIRERIQEMIQHGTLLIDTEGERVGQINGLALMPFGEQMFGKPSRITATVRLGKGEVLDIEREVELGGPVHSKGVLILSGYLAGRYARGLPMPIAASIVFEQSYAHVAGDSASCAELMALISAIAEVPLKQAIAMTGSVNQRGQVQAIGGVNDKIEGYFDTCNAAGLTGEQGVIIPQSNARHLMLRRDVVDAVEAGQFNVWAVSTVDEVIELLTGQPAGEADARGEFPDDSVNGKVRAAIRRYVEAAKQHLPAGSDGGNAAGQSGES